jgi:two-component system, sensor histidine kinase and response regulator
MYKILVIDDSKAIRESLTDILSLEGYECLEADNGKAGTLIAQEYIPDLIICDIMMPEMDGHGVIEVLRENPLTSTIPFIFLTAMSQRQDLRKGMEMGADDYITKPFTCDEILNAVKYRLEKSHGFQKKLNQLRESIARSLPHEIRTPLVSIIGYSEMMKEFYQELTPDQIYDYSKTINDSSIRLNNLIQNYILYSRFIINKNEKNEEVKICYNKFTSGVITKILDKIASVHNRQNDLNMSIEDVELPILIEYFNKIICELADNAFKFSTHGSKVKIKCYKEDIFYIINIKDNGRGMTAEQIANIGAYQQFDRKEYEQQGSGLGLFLAMHLVNLYRGLFNIKSVPGKGTSVSVYLPLKIKSA